MITSSSQSSHSSESTYSSEREAIDLIERLGFFEFVAAADGWATSELVEVMGSTVEVSKAGESMPPEEVLRSSEGSVFDD